MFIILDKISGVISTHMELVTFGVVVAAAFAISVTVNGMVESINQVLASSNSSIGQPTGR